MPEEKFTPGPWKHEMWGEIWPVGDGGLIADALNNEANARLIAEAPAMFALLKEFSGKECLCPECIAARAIIARVLGEE